MVDLALAPDIQILSMFRSFLGKTSFPHVSRFNAEASFGLCNLQSQEITGPTERTSMQSMGVIDKQISY